MCGGQGRFAFRQRCTLARGRVEATSLARPTPRRVQSKASAAEATGNVRKKGSGGSEVKAMDSAAFGLARFGKLWQLMMGGARWRKKNVRFPRTGRCSLS